MATKRRNISFKDNQRDKTLLIYIEDMSKVYGFSAYIKNLIEKDLKESGLYDTYSGSR